MTHFGRPYHFYVSGGMTSASFFTIHNGFTCEIEAGWVNDPKDKGGETLFGISRKANPRWGVWPKVDEIAKTLPRGSLKFKATVEKTEFFISAARLFYAKYFMAQHLTEVEDQIAYVMYDLGVHAGTERATIMAQRTYNKVLAPEKQLDDDGVLGPLTLKALKSIPNGNVETEFAKAYIDMRLKWHLRVNPEYTKGFTRRCHDLWRFLFGTEMP